MINPIAQTKLTPLYYFYNIPVRSCRWGGYDRRLKKINPRLNKYNKTNYKSSCMFSIALLGWDYNNFYKLDDPAPDIVSLLYPEKNNLLNSRNLILNIARQAGFYTNEIAWELARNPQETTNIIDEDFINFNNYFIKKFIDQMSDNKLTVNDNDKNLISPGQLFEVKNISNTGTIEGLICFRFSRMRLLIDFIYDLKFFLIHFFWRS